MKDAAVCRHLPMNPLTEDSRSLYVIIALGAGEDVAVNCCCNRKNFDQEPTSSQSLVTETKQNCTTV